MKAAANQHTTQVRQTPKAPPVYRPQSVPKVLQTKKQAAHQPADQSRRAPVAPPAYRPQPVPKVLQTKKAVGPTHRQQQSLAGQTPGLPVAPPVYRPEHKKIVQPKMSVTAQGRKLPKAPPVYRPGHKNLYPVQRKVVIDYDENLKITVAEMETDEELKKEWKPEYKRILEAMLSSETTFTYDDEYEMLKELKMRDQLVKAMTEINKQKDEGEVGYAGSGKRDAPNKLPANQWTAVTATHRGDKVHDNVTFRAKEGQAYNALNKLFTGHFNGAVYLECESAMVASHYRALSQVLGQDEFDGEYGATMAITMLDTTFKEEGTNLLLPHALVNVMEDVEITSLDELIPGDWVYFANFPGYEQNARKGAYTGENAIYEGGGKYSGFGLPKMTYAQMVKHLTDAYTNDAKDAKNPGHPKDTEKQQTDKSIVDGKYPGIEKKIHRVKHFKK
jgi:hypothetical protein